MLLPQYAATDHLDTAIINSTAYFNFQLTDESKISISGNSNVNEFNCLVYQDYANGNGIVERNSTDQHLKFSQTNIRILVKSLSCDNQVMDYDMYQALKSDKYPYITLDLKEAYPAGSQNLNLNNGVDLFVKAELSLAGIKKMQLIRIRATTSEQGRLIFRGKHKINLKDFNIEPPTALFGVIKVKDEVLINFDLIVIVK